MPFRGPWPDDPAGPARPRSVPVLGFRIGDLAYCTDVNRIPDESWGMLGGLDTLVLDALRIEPHPTHFSLERGPGGDRPAEAAADSVHTPVSWI